MTRFLVLFCLVFISAKAFSQDTARGQKLFEDCRACHAIERGQQGVGPDLHGVVGRAIGSASGYDEYSAAMKSRNGKWTVEQLDEFLRNPQQSIPGNAMGFAGIPDQKLRQALVQYLSKQAETH